MSEWPSRLLCLAIFAGASLAHHLLLGDADGILYYCSAAFFDLIVIFTLSRLSVIYVHVLFMQVICLLLIMANCIGWVIWYLYLPPTYYDLACYALYIAAILCLFIRGGNGRDIRNNQLRTCFNLHRFESGFNYTRDKSTA